MPPKKKPSSSKKGQATVVANEATTSTHTSGSFEGSPSGEDHVLLKLPLTDEQLDVILKDNGMGSVLQYDPILNEPQPYVPANPFLNDPEEAPRPQLAVTLSTSAKNDAVHTYPDGSGMTGVTKKQKTCFWCCHEVGHMTYGMPIRYDLTTRTFTMYGTFCSLECAAAHNFSVHLGSDRAWEIHSWIQMIGKRFGYTEPIRPAPSRYLLDMFDGPLTIREFRNAPKGQTRTYVLNIPPIISVNSQMEVVNTSFLGNTESINKTPTDKPMRKPKTLDAKMNLILNAQVESI